ncbi:MAG: nucleotidyltransferase family protein [Clostridia bacterium]|nr:nucleotidyltransferase family protein [Clostridia bacterium]
MKEFEMITSLIRFSIQGEPLSDVSAIDEQTLKSLYQLSKKHDLAHLIGDALEKNGLLLDGTEVKKRFLQQRSLAIYRYEQMQYELECMCEVFESAGIDFIPLKGSILKLLYPEPWMRTSCDLDVLVRKTDLQKAVDILKEKLQYNCSSIGEYDAQVFAESGVHLELHFRLVEDEAKPEEMEILDNIWNGVEASGDCYKHMTDAYFYCHHISHLAKHLKYGGCGVRAILDTWILNHSGPYNKEERYALLNEAGLLVVSQAVEKLADVWFSGAEADALSEVLAEYVLTGGLYGNFENKVAAQKSKKKNQFTYLFSRLFLSYRQMLLKYPKLQKCPILYPFYIVKRWCLLLNKKKRNLAMRELNQTVHGDEMQDNIAKLMNELDL